MGRGCPLKRTGGAWPSEWIDLFERWIRRQRALLGTARNLVLREDDDDLDLITLSCRSRRSAVETVDGSLAWFKSESAPRAAIPAYRLYILAGEGSPAPSTVEISCVTKHLGRPDTSGRHSSRRGGNAPGQPAIRVNDQACGTQRLS